MGGSGPAIIALTLSLAAFLAASLARHVLAFMDPSRIAALAAEGHPRAATLVRLGHCPGGLTGGVDLLRLLTLMAALVSGTALAMGLGGGAALILASTVVVAALLLLLEAAARRLASRGGEALALRLAGTVLTVTWPLIPLLAAARYLFAAGVIPPSQAGQGNGESPVPELPDERETRMIRAVMRLDETVAREIMVPRVDIVAAPSDATVADVAQLMVRHAHSKVPVFKDTLDQVQGIAYARDVLGYLVGDDGDPGDSVERLVRPAFFIPESKALRELLDEFQEKRIHIAIVVDEYGGVAGLVTIEDLLEEIVGEIHDEFEAGEPEVLQVRPNEYLVDARVTIEQINDLMGSALQGNGFDTVGGLVYQRLGKIPAVGDVVDHDGLRIEVVSTVGRRLKRLRVSRLEGAPQEGPGEGNGPP